jgi:hypothetical protein
VSTNWARHLFVSPDNRDYARIQQAQTLNSFVAFRNRLEEGSRTRDRRVLPAVHWSRIDDMLNQAHDVSDKVVGSCSLLMSDNLFQTVVRGSWLRYGVDRALEPAKRKVRARA